MTNLEIGALLHEGKAKKVFRTNREGVVAVQFKDDATAFNAQKKAQLGGKGLLNWEISARLFEALETRGVCSHYLGCLEPGWMAVQEVKIVPLEVVLRNLAAGSLCKEMPIALDTPLEPPLLDLYYKDDCLGDPLLSEARLRLLGLVDDGQRSEIEQLAWRVNDALRQLFAGIELELVDFKIELGFSADGQLLLADEISPDNCRLWDRGIADSHRGCHGGVEPADAGRRACVRALDAVPVRPGGRRFHLASRGYDRRARDGRGRGGCRGLAGGGAALRGRARATADVQDSGRVPGAATPPDARRAARAREFGAVLLRRLPRALPDVPPRVPAR